MAQIVSSLVTWQLGNLLQSAKIFNLFIKTGRQYVPWVSMSEYEIQDDVYTELAVSSSSVDS